MPPLSDKELEERLAAAGVNLVQPPPSIDDLLPLLDRIEELLSKVEQSPAKSMQTALSPLMKALITEELLKHSDIDVKVGVASCISEITRITAPDAPYDDDKMKDVFQLIVSSFENLSDTSSKSYEKRATILETVAKVRSCVIMLDLECDQMIIEMFQHFLKAIRDYHADIIFASMETIMTLVLEESEEISPDLLTPILDTLKLNNEDVMPIAKKLAERVIQNSAEKLRPYLRLAVKFLNTSVDDYSDIVSSVCQEITDTAGHSNESISKDQPVVEGKCTSASPARDPTQAPKDRSEETNFQDKDPTLIRSPKSVVSNGIDEIGTKEIMTDANSSERADANCQLDAKSMSKTDPDDWGTQNQVKLDDKVEHAEAQQVPCNRETPDKDVRIPPTEDKPVEAVKSLDKVEDNSLQLVASKAPEVEAVLVVSPTQSVSHPDESRSETDILEKRKENLVSEETVSIDTASKKPSEEESVSEANKQWHLGEKQIDESADKDKALTEEVASKNDDGCASDSEARSLDQTEKLGDASNKSDYGSSLRKKYGKKSGRVKPTFEKDVPKSSAREVHEKDTVIPRRSPLKSTKNEGIQEETPKMSTKRKRTPGKEKASGTPEYGENLVGAKVKVWWPKDRLFYEGVIASFDSAKKKHKVLYNDGDKEVLNLRRERWEFIGDDLLSDGDQDVEQSSRDTSSDMHRKKKGNVNPGTSSKRQKVAGSPKSRIKDTATKSGGNSKDEGKAESESKENFSKPRKKSADDTVKSKDQSEKLGGKGEVDSAKASGRSKDDRAKQDSQQTPRSKGKTPQSGKSVTSSGTRMTKSSSLKMKGTDRMKEKTVDSAKSSETGKGKSIDTAKSRESETTKGGKKRRR